MSVTSLTIEGLRTPVAQRDDSKDELIRRVERCESVVLALVDLLADHGIAFPEIDDGQPHEFVGEDVDCGRCGEGRCFYLHTDGPSPVQEPS